MYVLYSATHTNLSIQVATGYSIHRKQFPAEQRNLYRRLLDVHNIYILCKRNRHKITARHLSAIQKIIVFIIFTIQY